MLLVTGCATAPAAVWRMTPEELIVLETAPLCQALAAGRADRRAQPAVEAEAARRGVGCEQEIAWSVSDCSMLALIKAEPAPQGTVFTVRNNSGQVRTFRTYAGGLSSERMWIEPGQTLTFGIGTAPLVATAARGLAMTRGDLGAQLYECLLARWGPTGAPISG